MFFGAARSGGSHSVNEFESRLAPRLLRVFHSETPPTQFFLEILMKKPQTIIRQRQAQVLHVVNSVKCLSQADRFFVDRAMCYVSAAEIIKRMSGVRGDLFKNQVLRSFIPKKQPLFK